MPTIKSKYCHSVSPPPLHGGCLVSRVRVGTGPDIVNYFYTAMRSCARDITPAARLAIVDTALRESPSKKSKLKSGHHALLWSKSCLHLLDMFPPNVSIDINFLGGSAEL